MPSDRFAAWIQQASLDELNRRADILASLIGTDSEDLVEEEFNLIQDEIMFRTVDPTAGM